MTAGGATVKGVEVEIDAEAVVVRFDDLLPVVSSAPAGGSAADSSPAQPVRRLRPSTPWQGSRPGTEWE
jgi:hypothetical protein